MNVGKNNRGVQGQNWKNWEIRLKHRPDRTRYGVPISKESFVWETGSTAIHLPLPIRQVDMYLQRRVCIQQKERTRNPYLSMCLENMGFPNRYTPTTEHHLHI